MNAKLSALLFVVFGFSGCSTPDAPGGESLPPLEAGEGTIEGPDLAALEDGRIAATWATVDAEGQADVVLSFFDRAANRWGPRRLVNPSRGSAVAGRQVGPQVVVCPDATIAVSWVDRARDPAGDILISVSEDEGRSFSTPRRVNDDTGSRGQEYHDIALAPGGTLCAVWLDERDAPPGAPNQKQVYFAVSDDGGHTFSRNRVLTASSGGVCPCCRPSVTVGPDGSIHVVFRDRRGDALFLRVVSRLKGEQEFSTPVTISDGWVFPGCPVNGPVIAAGPEQRVWVLWVEDGKLWWARSEDRGHSFGIREVVESSGPAPSGTAVHLALEASGKASAVATWEDVLGQICLLELPAFGRGPLTPSLVSSRSRTAIARCPAIEVTTEELSICWVEDALESPPGTSGERVPRIAVLAWPRTHLEDESLLFLSPTGGLD